MIETTITEDGQALLLLCSTLGLPCGVKPLGLSEWNRVSASLASGDYRRPSDLLGQTTVDLQSRLRLDNDLAERTSSLLARGGQLAFELERLSSRGIWVVTRADAEYPARLRQRLKQQAPPVLFGAGPAPDEDVPALAIVGSRDVDDEGLVFARRLAASSADAGFTVVSGGARGTDTVAQEAALESDGRVWAVLADSLERTLQKKASLAPVRAGKLTLLTPFHPAAPFSVGHAMSRNRLIYALADAAVVVSSASGEGGTWAGAVENLERAWAPLYVRSAPAAPPGNLELLQRGGRALTVEQAASPASLQAVVDSLSL